MVGAQSKSRQVEHQARRSTQCPTSPYTCPNGLTFDQSCGRSLNDDDNSWLSTNNQPSFQACMNSCGVWSSRCNAVAYNDKTTHCLLFSGGAGAFTNATSNGSVAYFGGVARPSQLQAPIDLSCPYPQNSVQTIKSSERFQVLCGQDFGGDGGDFCPDNLMPWRCPVHANTLEECMDFCSHAHPLCKGVTWNPDMQNGYGNCYMKNNPTGAVPSTPTDVLAHSAEVTVTFYSDVDPSCPTNDSYVSPSGSNFTIHCYDGREGSQNFTSVHRYNLEECMDTCDSNIEQGCAGVIFDMSMELGYDNCYLLNDSGSPSYGANASFAQLKQSTHSGASSMHADGGGSSEAWIAGPVIGVLAFLAMLAVCFVYWRRRRSRSQHASSQKRIESPPHGERSSMNDSSHIFELTPNERQLPEKDSVLRHELNDPNSERVYLNEVGT